MSSYIILFLLFGLPFVIFPIGASFFESPKVILFELLVLFFAGVVLFSNKNQIIFKKNYLPLIVLFLLSIFHLLFMSSANTFLGNTFRGQGILLLWCLLLFVFIIPKMKKLTVPQWLPLLLLFLQLVASLFIEAKEGRAIGTLGEPNALAAFAVFVWPYALTSEKLRAKSEKFEWKMSNKSSLVMVMGSILLSMLIIIFSGSRSGLVALGIQITFLLATRFVSLGKATVLACILLLISLIPPILDTETLYENRGEIWTTALYAGYEHPLIGWGFGNTEIAFEEYNEKLYNRLRDYYVDSSHNFILDWWVQGGFIGLTILVLLLFDAIKRFVVSNNKIYLMLILGLLGVMSFNPVSVVTLVQFWWLIGEGVRN